MCNRTDGNHSTPSTLEEINNSVYDQAVEAAADWPSGPSRELQQIDYELQDVLAHSATHIVRI